MRTSEVIDMIDSHDRQITLQCPLFTPHHPLSDHTVAQSKAALLWNTSKAYIGEDGSTSKFLRFGISIRLSKCCNSSR